MGTQNHLGSRGVMSLRQSEGAGANREPSLRAPPSSLPSLSPARPAPPPNPRRWQGDHPPEVVFKRMHQNNSTEVPPSGVYVGLYQADGTNQHTNQDTVPIFTSSSIMLVTLVVVIASTLTLQKPDQRALHRTCFCHLLNPFIVSPAVTNCQEGPRHFLPSAGLSGTAFMCMGIFFLLQKSCCGSRHLFSMPERKMEMGKKQVCMSPGAEAGAMAQWLRALAALAADPDSNPSTHTVIYNCR
ncbi:mCG147388 [Mus musculus]|jgi:hypothetical protein|nr:mCG147388 [Mus musculus]